MATAPRRVSDASQPTKGDETLVGTQLQVISQLHDGTVDHKFQLTSAVGLAFEDGKAFQDAVGDGNGDTAVEILKAAGEDDPRFLAVLTAVMGNQSFASLISDLRGKDGLPNLRLIFDYAPPTPSATFQFHTILDILTSDGPNALRRGIALGDVTTIAALVKAHCKLTFEEPFMKMLAAALS